MASSSLSPSSVRFPGSDASPQRPLKPAARLGSQHLPFRRISIPTVPSISQRLSVVSIVSSDSLPEFEGREADGSAWSSPRSAKKTHSDLGDASRRRQSKQREPADERKALKRQRVIEEFCETERAYVEGLELIYDHFLTPIIVSLETPEPLLNRSALTAIFSNFIDIWNFHRSFLPALTDLLSSSKVNSSTLIPFPPLSPLLLSHFPYLSLYTPFVTAFPSTIASLTELVNPPTPNRPNPCYDLAFTAFLSSREADPRCGKLKLRDWLLTIVQRCPRYLLLLKDLINCTEATDSEYQHLTTVHALVSKITLSLNSSLQAHAQTLELLALQRATPNLPFQLIVPGRTFLRRGALLQVEGSGVPQEREFLLFSDCLIWLSSGESASSWDWSWSGSGNGSSELTNGQTSTPISTPTTSAGIQDAVSSPAIKRTRSNSEADKLNHSDAAKTNPGFSHIDNTASSPQQLAKRRSYYASPAPIMPRRQTSSDDKWVFRGRLDLVDVDVVIGSALEDDRRVEILSPQGSFAIYGLSQQDRDEWTSAIRTAKSHLLASLNATNPNSTLTSSTSNNHIRRALQALPYPPEDERMSSIRASHTVDDLSAGDRSKGRKHKGKKGQIRRKVDHWVPAIWIPDGKTTSCMRCGRPFGWRRRRHHCRLCGRCVCAGCSGRTFFITDTTGKTGKAGDVSSKPARACDACYESVFPVVDDDASVMGLGSIGSTDNLAKTAGKSSDPDHSASQSTIGSLSALPSWLSMPSLPVRRVPQPQALMAIDLNSPVIEPSATMSADLYRMSGPFHDGRNDADGEGVADDEDGEREVQRGRVRKAKEHVRVRSTQQILEDFEERGISPNGDHGSSGLTQAAWPRHSDRGQDASSSSAEDSQTEVDDDGDDLIVRDFEDLDDVFLSPPVSPLSKRALFSQVSPRTPYRKEDTARRSKRFSLPAIAVQTQNVTARTSAVGDNEAMVYLSEVLGLNVVMNESMEDSGGLQRVAKNRGSSASRRVSLVVGPASGIRRVDEATGSDEDVTGGLRNGLAVAKLNELLERGKAN